MGSYVRPIVWFSTQNKTITIPILRHRLQDVATIIAGDFNYVDSFEDRMDHAGNYCGQPSPSSALFGRLFNRFYELHQSDYTRSPGSSQIDGTFSRIDRIYINIHELDYHFFHIATVAVNLFTQQRSSDHSPVLSTICSNNSPTQMPVIQAWIPKHPDYFPLMHEKLKECQDDSPWQMCKRIKAVMHEVSQKIKNKKSTLHFHAKRGFIGHLGLYELSGKGTPIEYSTA